MDNINNPITPTEGQEFALLDAITIVGFLAQLDNMEQDEKETQYIRTVIQAIANEIEKIHKDNEKIIKQNEEILYFLRKEEVE
jgi:hypothetical protein